MKILIALVFVVVCLVTGKLVLDARRNGEITRHEIAVDWPDKDVLRSLGEPASRYGNLRGGESWRYPSGLTVELTTQGKVYNLKREAPFGTGATPVPSR